jgi:hypothetical protein
LASLGKKLLVSCLLSSALGSAWGTSNFVGLNGKSLHSICSSTNRDFLSACEGYILGIQDTVQNHKFGFLFSLCFPDGVTVTMMRKQLLEYMEIRTHLFGEPAVEMVTGMFARNYACKVD